MRENEKTAVSPADMMHVYGGIQEKVDYTVRITVRMTDDVDRTLLQKALEKTQCRYPYFSATLLQGENDYYYIRNTRPVRLIRGDGRIRLNAPETNGHVWAVCYQDDRIHLDIYHGITDGTGMYKLLATLLYYYCHERYGLEKEKGIYTAENPVSAAETADPFEKIPDPAELPEDVPVPAFVPEKDGGLTPSGPTIWDVEIPEAAFMRFTSDNDASPGTLISLLFARTLDALFPERKKEIISAYVINARPMLQAYQTHHNCLGMALFPYSARVRKMPFSRQCTVYRGMTFVQSDADRIRPAAAVNAAYIRMAAQAPDLQAKKEAFGQMFGAGEGRVSFLVSYTGKWPYPGIGQYIRELWLHPPNTFPLMVEVGAAGGRIFLSVQQRFRENVIREAFLRTLEENQIPYRLVREMKSDIAAFGGNRIGDAQIYIPDSLY